MRTNQLKNNSSIITHSIDTQTQNIDESSAGSMGEMDQEER